MATTALAVTGPTPGAVVERVAIGSSFANAALRVSATASCALSGANTANRGASSVVHVGGRSSSAIRVGTHAPGAPASGSVRAALPTGGEAAVGARAVVGVAGQRALALVQGQASDRLGGWPPGRRPVARR
jgi:hypothetical protein